MELNHDIRIGALQRLTQLRCEYGEIVRVGVRAEVRVRIKLEVRSWGWSRSSSWSVASFAKLPLSAGVIRVRVRV